MISPMQVLEETPRVWLVHFYGRWYDDTPYVHSVYRTEEGAKASLDKIEDDERKYFGIEWEELHD